MICPAGVVFFEGRASPSRLNCGSFAGDRGLQTLNRTPETGFGPERLPPGFGLKKWLAGISGYRSYSSLLLPSALRGIRSIRAGKSGNRGGGGCLFVEKPGCAYEVRLEAPDLSQQGWRHCRSSGTGGRMTWPWVEHLVLRETGAKGKHQPARTQRLPTARPLPKYKTGFL